jgi:glycosyltransferase involved in cell wall biosynthesis
VDRCNALVDAGEIVTAVQWHEADTEYIWDAHLQKKFNVVNICSTSAPSLVYEVYCTARLAWRCVAERADIYIVYGYQKRYFFIVAILLRALFNIVFSINDSKFDDYTRRLFRELFKWIFLLPYSGFLAGSQRAAVYLKYFGRKNIQKYYCAIDLERVRRDAESSPEYGRPYGERHFTMISRFIAKKNHFMLLSAFEAYAKASQSPRRLMLCGYGPLEKEIRDRIGRSAILKELVDFRGYVNAREVASVLASSLALVLPSTEEQFGIVVTEALACSVPVLVSENCGAADLVENSVNGFKLEAENENGFSFFMQLLSTDERLWNRMSGIASTYAEKADVSAFVGAVNKLEIGTRKEVGIRASGASAK